MQQERFPTSIAAEFAVGRVQARGEIANVGPGGLFVGSRTIPETGDMVRVRFEGPDGGRILVSGIVWWTTEGRTAFGRSPGFGVRLLESAEPYDSFVGRLSAEHRARKPRARRQPTGRRGRRH